MKPKTKIARTVLLALATLLFCSCQPKHGSVAGNAYWKYNDYVGNKPDAGSEVFLFSSDTSKTPTQTNCDVQGNFSFNDIPVGDYFLVVQSKAANSSSADQMNDFLEYLGDPIISFYGKGSDPIIKNFIDSYYEAKKHEIAPIGGTLAEIKLNSDSLYYYRHVSNKLADSILNMMPADCPVIKWCYHSGMSNSDFAKLKIKLNGLGWKKIKVQKVKVEPNRTSNVIIDFGVTYL